MDVLTLALPQGLSLEFTTLFGNYMNYCRNVDYASKPDIRYLKVRSVWAVHISTVYSACVFVQVVVV